MAETIVTQELAVRVGIPTAAPGGTIPAVGTTLVKDSNTDQLTYIPASMPGQINTYAPASWPAAIANYPVLFLDSDSGNLMIRMPTNAPFNGVVREITASDPL